jgi:hypothetical protein
MLVKYGTLSQRMADDQCTALLQTIEVACDGATTGSGGATAGSSSGAGGEGGAAGPGGSGGTAVNDGGTIADAGGPLCTKDNVVGTWSLAAGLPGGLSATFTFNADGTYTTGFYTAAATVGFFDEIQTEGTYTISGAGILTNTPGEMSCPTAMPTLGSQRLSIATAPEMTPCFLSTGDLILETTVLTPSIPLDPSKVALGCGTPFVSYPLMPISVDAGTTGSDAGADTSTPGG